jgi:hypothetical protein
MALMRPILDRYTPTTVATCSICGKPTHPHDSDDLDRCASCQPKEKTP